MNVAALQPKMKASDVALENLAANKNFSDREKIDEVARQFEAVLLRQMLQETRKSAVTSTSSADASTSGIYDDMINNQLADCMSRSGSFGLAKSLQAQLAHQVLPGATAAAPTLTPTPAEASLSKTHKK
jgi:Rod binding domain-containing protein